MKLITILFAAFIVVFGNACGNEASNTEATETVDPNAQAAPAATETAPVEFQAEPAPVQEGAPSNIQATPAADGTTAPGMNPPHGQPGHRCDIAVGAPLPK